MPYNLRWFQKSPTSSTTSPSSSPSQRISEENGVEHKGEGSVDIEVMKGNLELHNELREALKYEAPSKIKKNPQKIDPTNIEFLFERMQMFTEMLHIDLARQTKGGWTMQKSEAFVESANSQKEELEKIIANRLLWIFGQEPNDELSLTDLIGRFTQDDAVITSLVPPQIKEQLKIFSDQLEKYSAIVDRQTRAIEIYKEKHSVSEVEDPDQQDYESPSPPY